MTTPPRPVRDLDSAPFWDALDRHELLVQRCTACGSLQFPFRPVCTACLAPSPSTIAVSGTGEIVSWITTHRVFHPAFADRVPYTTVLVRLAEQSDLLVYGGWLGPVALLREGLRVHGRFSDHEGFTLVDWEPQEP